MRPIMSCLQALNGVTLSVPVDFHGMDNCVLACASAHAAEHSAAAKHQIAAEHNAAAEHHAAAEHNAAAENHAAADHNGSLACVGVMAKEGSF